MKLTRIPELVNQQWQQMVRVSLNEQTLSCEIEATSDQLVEVCGWLCATLSYRFAGLIVEEKQSEWELRYLFIGDGDAGCVHVLAHQALTDKTFPSIAARVHAADWHEREAEDLFGLVFTGHPRLGNFLLHNDRWQENLCPMRHSFDGAKPVDHREPQLDWRPQRIVKDPGAFAMPIGPIYSGVTESVHFLLETVGEDVIRTIPRLFYKFRAIEKIAEGRHVNDVLLLAERIAATTAFSHALAYCQAVENICNIQVPPRATVLRMFMAELERFRHHVGAILEICESTALIVATNQMAMLEEEVLRLTCALTGHRYLFGLTVPGGLTRTIEAEACQETLQKTQEILQKIDKLEKMLYASSSFLDRLEEVGVVSHSDAGKYGLVGPVKRASGHPHDLRKARPYSGYETVAFDVPCEIEGDGYARLRVLFAEVRQAVRLMEQARSALRDGPILAPAMEMRPGAALGWAETPRGATFHWLRMGENGQVIRFRPITPSFVNWHGFHLAAENFAFQDFPIILATFDLSVADNDR